MAMPHSQDGDLNRREWPIAYYEGQTVQELFRVHRRTGMTEVKIQGDRWPAR